MTAEQFIICLLSAAVGALGWSWWHQRRHSTAPTSTDNPQQQAALMATLADLQHRLHQSDTQLRHDLQERLDVMIRQLSIHQQQNSQQMTQQQNQSSVLVQQIGTQLHQIATTNQRVLGFAEQIHGLERIFSSPKQRGLVGEWLLDNLLAHIMPPQQYQLQYRFESGVIVDAAVFFKDTIIPIDAKFPLEKYQRLQATTNPQQKNTLERQFKTDLKNRIDETAKYVLTTQGTADFALMFVPAEGIYYQLLQYTTDTIEGRTADLLQYGFSRKVILVSPTTFYAYLSTVLHGIGALQIAASVQEVVQKIGELQKHLRQYDEQLQRLGKQIQTTQTTYDQARREFDRIDKSITQIQHAQQQPPHQKQSLF